MEQSLEAERAECPVFTDRDVRAWREGNWVFVTLADELVYKRYTRDRAFTAAWVVFSGNRSPDYPKQRRFFDKVVLRGAWPVPWRDGHWLRNRLEAQIEQG